ncbi:MAG TPA: hypothetical protein VM934_08675 [Pyrinomonadaceae bacterium]|jgi:hypothetical protein|nr:hypothetical protein [Pyrinomonadaceae bacterium]
MKEYKEFSQIYAKGLEHLRISELLMEEAVAKQEKREAIEALELRAEALAYQSRGVELLDEAIAGRRDSLKNGTGKSHARGNAL